MKTSIFNHLTTFDVEQFPLYRRYLKYNLPLEASEEESLLQSARQGSQYAIIRIMFANMGLIMHAIQRVYCPYIDLDDLVDAGLLGIWKAIRSFQPNRNFCFSTYAYRCITTSLADCIREYGFHEHEEKEDEPINTNIIAESCGDNDSYAPDFTLIEEAYIELINNLLCHLPNRKASVLRMLYGLDGNEYKTAKEIAQLHGITHQRVRQIREEAIRDIRQYCLSKKVA